MKFISAQGPVNCISAEGENQECIEIFLELQEGSIEKLIQQDLFRRRDGLPSSLLHQMLQAIDYLASRNMVHRDVKPSNILYTPLDDGGYRFQFADFGLCGSIDHAKTRVGTPAFMAPEVLENGEASQTSKVDVWSLFVTLAYATDIGGYRGKELRTNEQIIQAALEAADHPDFEQIKKMAIEDPFWRASTAPYFMMEWGVLLHGLPDTALLRAARSDKLNFGVAVSLGWNVGAGMG